MATGSPLTGSEHIIAMTGLPRTGSDLTTATDLALTGSVPNGSWFAVKLQTVFAFLMRSSSSPSTEQSVVHGSISTQSQTQPYVLNRVTKAVREQGLGKVFISVAFPIAVGTVLYFKDKSSVPFHAQFAVACSLMGVVVITVGLSVRHMMPRTSDVFEQSGIIMVLVAFNLAAKLLLPVWVLLLIFCAVISFAFTASCHSPNTEG